MDKATPIQTVATPVTRIDAPALDVITRGEIDMQIATARRYPRSITVAINKAKEMACLDPDTAGQCGYMLKREGKPILGPSVRLAEIIALAWGNLRCAARIVDEGAKFVTGQGVVHDLETNVALSAEVRRRITRRDGSRYSDDMVAVTANAATAIAFRNAIFKIIPKAHWLPVYEAAMKVAAGDAGTLTEARDKLLKWFAGRGLEEKPLLKLLGRKGIADIVTDDIVVMRQLATAIHDGDWTVASIRDEMSDTKPKPGQSQGDALAERLGAKPEPKPAENEVDQEWLEQARTKEARETQEETPDE